MCIWWKHSLWSLKDKFLSHFTLRKIANYNPVWGSSPVRCLQKLPDFLLGLFSDVLITGGDSRSLLCSSSSRSKVPPLLLAECGTSLTLKEAFLYPVKELASVLCADVTTEFSLFIIHKRHLIFDLAFWLRQFSKWGQQLAKVLFIWKEEQLLNDCFNWLRGRDFLRLLLICETGPGGIGTLVIILEITWWGFDYRIFEDALAPVLQWAFSFIHFLLITNR